LTFEDAVEMHLEEILLRVAFFNETHAIKGLLAIGRLHTLEGQRPDFVAESLGWDQVLATPAITGLVSENIQLPNALSERRRRGFIEEAVFPMAYYAGTEWVRDLGYRHLIDSFRDKAIARTGYLGHSWTIWCSFHEIEPHLKTERHRLCAAERFVEFCASQLSDPDWTPAYTIDSELKTLPVSESEAIHSILCKPGFYGHRVITLAHLFKYRGTLSEAQWSHCLERMYDASNELSGSVVHDIQVPAPEHPTDVSVATFHRAVVRFLTEAARAVHTLTLADAIVELYGHVEDHGHLIRILERYGAWSLAR
jgi:hypothetical protein